MSRKKWGKSKNPNAIENNLGISREDILSKLDIKQPITKKNHYVSQVYIKNFSYTSDNRLVTLLNKHTMIEVKNKKSDDVLFEKKLYWSHDEETNNEILNEYYEKFFGRVENSASETLRLFYSNESFTNKDISNNFHTILDFIAVSPIRTQLYIKSQTAVYELLKEKIHSLINSSELGIVMKDKLRKEVEAVENPKLIALESMIPSAKKILSNIVSKVQRIRIYKSDSLDFISSDNPAIFMKSGKILSPLNAGDFDCILFPISMKSIAILSTDSDEGWIDGITDDIILNLIILNSIDLLFFDPKLLDKVKDRIISLKPLDSDLDINNVALRSKLSIMNGEAEIIMDIPKFSSRDIKNPGIIESKVKIIFPFDLDDPDHINLIASSLGLTD